MRFQELTQSVTVIGALLLGTPASYAQYAINLFAGGGPNGLSGVASSIGYPGGVARDGSGNTYIADSYSNRIFKVDGSGTLTVFAGNASGVGGQGGYSGDGGPAASAQLGRPEGVAVDAAGDVFIADTDNSVIRCVVGTANGCFGSALAVGSITTVAGVYYPASNTCNYSGDGGPAISAQLCQPGGLYVDGSGNLFIADTGNSVIREVAAGNIQTVAGDANLAPGYSGDGAAATAAQLDLPNGVFVDVSGNLFIADTYNSVIREVVASTGNIQTVAGAYYAYTFVCNFSGDGGLATSAQLCLPSGVSVDGSGNIFIADTFNSEVREVAASTGNIQAFAGTGGTAGYTGDGSTATSAELNDPNSLFVEGSGNVFIADTENFAVREVSSGTISTFAGDNTLAYSGDGGAATKASLNAPGALFVDGSGNLFVADTYNCVIREIMANGNIKTVAGSGICGYAGDNASATAASAQLDFPSGVFVDAGGNIFIADTNNSVIRCVVGTAGGCLGSAQAVGNITTAAGTGVGGYSGDGGIATSAQLYDPNGVFVDGGGNIFIADTTNSIIRCVVGSAGGCFGSALAVGSITTVAGTPGTPCADPGTSCGDGAAGTAAQLNYPAGVFGDASGNLFIADTFDSKIRCVVGSVGGCFGSALAVGNITTVAGTGVTGYSGDGGLATSGQLFDPYGVFVDNLGNVFIADSDNSAVREVVAVTGNIQTAAGNGTAGYAGDGGAGSGAELDIPLGIAGDASGNLFVADTENSRIRELSSTLNVAAIPNLATSPTGGFQQFAANVTGASDTSVTWQVNGVTGGNSTVGTISTLGSYQAPNAIPSPATVTVRAVANANGVKAASVHVTIVSTGTATVTVTTSPTVTEVYTSATQAFVANVTGLANPAVNWEVNGTVGGNAAVGTIASDGTYTAPAAVPSPATVVIGAVSQSNSNVSRSYPIVVVAAPTAAQPTPQTVSAGGAARYSISLNANTGDPKQPITLSCLQSTLPVNASCSFLPAKITPGASAVPFTLTISVPSASAALPKRDRIWAGQFAVSFVLPMVGILFVGMDKRKIKRPRWLPLLVLLCASTVLLVGCGGGGSSSGGSNTQPKTYSVQVQGTTAAQPNPTTITSASLTVQ